jgi:hypothetical protein
MVFGPFSIAARDALRQMFNRRHRSHSRKKGSSKEYGFSAVGMQRELVSGGHTIPIHRNFIL